MSSDAAPNPKKALKRLGIATVIIGGIVGAYAKSVANDKAIRGHNTAAKALLTTDNPADYRKAALELDASLAIRSKDRYALVNRAAVAATLAAEHGIATELPLAEELLGRARDAKYDTRELYLAEGLVLVAKGKASEAETAMSKVIDGGTTLSEVLMPLGLARLRQGKTEAALNNLMQASDIDARTRHWAAVYGEVAFDMGDYIAAAQAFGRGLTNPPPRRIPPPPKLKEGERNPNDNDNDAVANDRDKCPSEAEDKDQFEDQDGCPEPDNDKDGVLDEKDSCPTVAGPATNQGCSPHLRSLIGRTRTAVAVGDDLDKALATFDSVLAKPADELTVPLKARALAGKSEALRRLGRDAEAIETAKQAESAAPQGDLVAAHAAFTIGMAMAHQKDPGAAAQIKKAVSSAPGVAYFVFDGAEELAKAGDPAGGQELLDGYGRTNKPGPDYEIAKGIFMIATGKKADGIKLLDAGLTGNARNLQGWMALGEQYLTGNGEQKEEAPSCFAGALGYYVFLNQVEGLSQGFLEKFVKETEERLKKARIPTKESAWEKVVLAVMPPPADEKAEK